MRAAREKTHLVTECLKMKHLVERCLLAIERICKLSAKELHKLPKSEVNEWLKNEDFRPYLLCIDYARIFKRGYSAQQPVNKQTKHECERAKRESKQFPAVRTKTPSLFTLMAHDYRRSNMTRKRRRTSTQCYKTVAKAGQSTNTQACTVVSMFHSEITTKPLANTPLFTRSSGGWKTIDMTALSSAATAIAALFTISPIAT